MVDSRLISFSCRISSWLWLRIHPAVFCLWFYLYRLVFRVVVKSQQIADWDSTFSVNNHKQCKHCTEGKEEKSYSAIPLWLPSAAHILWWWHVIVLVLNWGTHYSEQHYMHAHKSSKYKTQPFKYTLKPEMPIIQLWMKSKMGQPYTESELWCVLLEHSSNKCKKVTVIYSSGKLNRFIDHTEVGFLPTFCALTSKF